MQPKGDCFVAAYKKLFEVMENPDSREWTLVHGTVAHLDNGNGINHAWVENAIEVLDYSNGLTVRMATEMYYAKLSVSNVIKYSPFEALAKSASSGHYGPWGAE